MTRTVNSDVKYPRQYVIATISRQSHWGRMDEEGVIEQRRERMRAFLAFQKPLKRNAVCKRAGVSESSLGSYVRGGDDAPRFLSSQTYVRLATWSKWTEAELKGDAPIPSREDILSRKNTEETETGSDSFTVVGQDAPAGPTGEGKLTLLELLEQIDELPPGQLARLKKHVDRLAGTETRPRKAGVAE